MRATWLGAALLAVAGVADAQEWLSPPPADSSPITDHMAFRAIYFFGSVSTRAQINPTPTVPGTNFDLEDEFGLTSKADQFRAEVMIRLEDRNRLRLGFLDLRRRGDKVVDQTITFGDTTFEAGEQVKSEFDYQQFDFAYTYSVLRAQRYELGVGVGVQFLQAQVNGYVPNTPKFETFSGAIPFGEPLLDGTYLIAKHWSFNARAQYLRVSVSSSVGLLEDYHADLQYRWERVLAIGLGYEFQEVGVNLPKNNPSGEVHLKLNGPEVFLRASF
jgi:hypothetical protein